MSLSNPFGKKPEKKTESTQNKNKKDSTRENVKKTLKNALEPKKDGNFKFSSEKIALEIEEEIFKQNNNNSQCKGYRDKIRKIEFRIKGNRNLFIREMLKEGLIEINIFCGLDDKTLNDDNYFKNIKKDDKTEENHIKENDNNINGKKKIKNVNPPPPIKKTFYKFENNNNIEKENIEDNIFDNFNKKEENEEINEIFGKNENIIEEQKEENKK